MKHLTFTIVLSLFHICTMGQKPVSYEAANWKLWQLDNPQKISISSPVLQSKAEIQAVKQAMNTLNNKKREAIRYWNAGAPAYRWNQIIIEVVDKNPESMLRIPGSWVNLAIYDATVLAWKEKLKYRRKRPSETDTSIKTIIDAPKTFSYPCEHSVTASAAAHVLAYFFPKQADSVIKLAKSAMQSRIDAGVQFPSDTEAGWKLGEQVALQIIEKAKYDGSDKPWDGQMNKDPKKWTGKYPVGITLASFTPMFLQTNNQFRPLPPPDFEKEMQEMKNFKQTFRSASIAYYWANTSTNWVELAGQKMFEYGIDEDAPLAARIYAVLATASHESAIAIMDAKYAYWGIRPNQYDTSYKPLISTPPFPGYPSGHAAGGATASVIMTYFFPADAKLFQQMAEECAESRFYAGIHFRTDNEVGLELGRNVGKYVVEKWMEK
ncbi:phosphatase PAP2 family protein [Emticicia sp. C21]|uniref:phosphatase PAP2 family protein n=1 Tax=Emticicia sp. C21 TaxID=2302915 RepID=UPI000E34C658|nr:phosphatase PAP2 family protein [Emticicia sp. C21]RFS17767.1 phosphatase PAP2 family protein [Emticicia sp. C21]